MYQSRLGVSLPSKSLYGKSCAGVPKETLDVVYRWYYETTTPANAQTWTSDAERVLEKLGVIRKVGGEYVHESTEGFNSVGLLQDSRQAEELGLHRIDPVRSRRAFRELRELQESASRLEEEGIGKGTAAGKIFSKLKDVFRENVHETIGMPEGPQPKFFVSKDVDRARILRDFLASDVWRTFCSLDHNSNDLPALFGMMKRHREELTLKWKNRPGGDDKKVDEWYRQVEAFVHACAEAAPESDG